MSLLAPPPPVATHWLAALGDRVNPIVVKETRQALKSQQFAVTFSLVLACCWVWSFLGSAIVGPDIFYGARGGDLLVGYLLILAAPLFVIVPSGAYRSLASQREDRNYELIYITSLRPLQVVLGKLASAALQVLLYLSAVSPCLAFTYLLRGVDVVTIVVLTLSTCAFSLVLSAFGLLLATTPAQRYVQNGLYALVLIGLVGLLWGWMLFAGVFVVEQGASLNSPESIGMFAAGMTFALAYGILALLVAASQLTFTSANRSTAARLALVLVHVVAAGWAGWFWMFIGQDELVVPMFCLTAITVHWYVAGLFLTAESPQLSARVRRGLPHNLLGRAMGLSLNPGPSTGLMLPLVAITSQAVVFYLLAWASWAGVLPRLPGTRVSLLELKSLFRFSLLLVCYLTIYLGMARGIGALVRRLRNTNVLLAPLLNALLLSLATAMPITVQMMMPFLRDDGYTLLQICNPFWSIAVAADNAISNNYSFEVLMLTLIVPSIAGVVLLLNLPGLLVELNVAPQSLPSRVSQDEAELHPAPPPAPRSPWE